MADRQRLQYFRVYPSSLVGKSRGLHYFKTIVSTSTLFRNVFSPRTFFCRRVLQSFTGLTDTIPFHVVDASLLGRLRLKQSFFPFSTQSAAKPKRSPASIRRPAKRRRRGRGRKS